MNFIDIAEILSKKPFVTPNTKSFQLHKWFQEHMHAFESQVQGVKAEEDFWENLVTSLFNACTTKKAQQYVWGHFASAQYPLENHLYKTGYAWLLRHKEASTPKTKSILDWSEQAFSSYSLQGAVCELPSASSIAYISKWIQSLKPEEYALPTVLARKYQSFDKNDRHPQAHVNKDLWMYVLIPALPYLNEKIKDAFHAPYLPCLHSPILNENLLDLVPESLHSWVIVNLLSSTNFYVTSIFESDYASTYLQKHIDLIDDPKICAYLVWDLLHRINDTNNATAIIERHCPTIACITNGLNIVDIEQLRNTVFQFWKEPAYTPSLSLPSDFDQDSLRSMDV